MTQLTLMRELLSVFSGNELVFGIVLGNWLLLTGIGAALGRTASRLKRPVTILIVAQILVAVLPIASVFLLRTLRNVVFLRGAEVGVTETVASCFVLLAPYCLIAGYLLTLATRVLAHGRDASSIGQVYFLDNIGDMIGGLLFSFVLIHLFDHFAGPAMPIRGRASDRLSRRHCEQRSGDESVEHNRCGNDENRIAHRAKRILPPVFVSAVTTSAIAARHDREVDPTGRYGNAEPKIDRRRRALPLADCGGDGGPLLGR